MELHHRESRVKSEDLKAVKRRQKLYTGKTGFGGILFLLHFMKRALRS